MSGIDDWSLFLKRLSNQEFYVHSPYFNTDKIVVERIPQLNIEYPVHNASFYPFFNSYYFYSNVSVLAILGHPLSWNSNELLKFKMMMTYLKHLGVSVIKPSELKK